MYTGAWRPYEPPSVRASRSHQLSERTRDEWLALVYARAEHLRWRRRLIAGGVALGLVIAVLVPTVVFSGGNKAKKLNVASGGASTPVAEPNLGGVVQPVPASPSSTTTPTATSLPAAARPKTATA